MTRWFSRLLTASAVAMLPQLVLADEPAKPEGPDAEALFKQLDANADGQIGRDEIDEQHLRLFKRLVRTADHDGDGKLNSAEFVAGLKEESPADPAEQPGPGVDRPARFRGDNPDALFKRLDANADGKIALDELSDERRERFARLLERADTDGDRALSLDEFRQAQSRLRKQAGGGEHPPGQGQRMFGGDRLFAALDTDGDGTLSHDEVSVAADSLKKLDTDGDGAITRREIMPGGPRFGQGFPGRPSPEQLVKRLMAQDKDGDGKLSPEEVPDFLREHFAKLDANGDGVADAEELERAAAEIQARFGQRGGRFRDRPKKEEPESDTPTEQKPGGVE